mgnify:CR=1 FL=1
MTAKVISLHYGDKRCATLFEALHDVLHERGEGIPVPAIVGVLELLKVQVISDAFGDD